MRGLLARRHRSGSGIRLITGLLLLFGAMLAHGQALPQDARSSPLTATGKISIVFDASISMCGYLRSGEKADENKLVSLAKIASEMSEKGDARVFFLAQQTPGSGDPILDMHPVGSNLYSAIHQVAENGADKCVVRDKKQCLIPSYADSNGLCPLFPGRDSSMNLIFSQYAATKDSDTILLVTDALFGNDTRKNFVNQYEEWIRRSGVPISNMSVGYTVGKARFSGKYYPEVDQDNARTGYSLDKHDRPLVVMWFSRNREHLPFIQQFVQVFNKGISNAPPSINVSGKQQGKAPDDGIIDRVELNRYRGGPHTHRPLFIPPLPCCN